MQIIPELPVNAAVSVLPWINSADHRQIPLGNSISCSVDRTIPAHQHLYLEGELRSHIHVVNSGVISIYKLLADGRRQICAFAYPGDILGIECSEQYQYNAEALSESVVRSIPARAIDKLMMREPGFGKALLNIIARELAGTRELLLSLGRKTAAEKLATFLLNIAYRNALAGQPADTIDLPMKRSDIADYLGLTVETVSRNFTRLKLSGVINLLSSTKIQIADASLLQAIAAGDESNQLH